jgi:hypothetical protein
LAPNKKQILERLKQSFSKIKKCPEELLAVRQYIIDAITLARNNTFVRASIWAFLFLLIISLVVVFRSYTNSKQISLGLQIYVYICAVFFYAVLVFAFYEFLKEKLYDLIVPANSGYDLETSKNAKFLTFGIIACMSIMIFLLIFDYFQHSKIDDDVGNSIVTECQIDPLKQASTPQKQESSAVETPVFLGTYGDFFGGVVNPVLTFGTLVALAITILMQRLQLRDARNENKENSLHTQQQVFENTFFNLLTLHTENVRNLRFDDERPGRKLSEGRAVFGSLLDYIGRNATSALSVVSSYRMLQRNRNDILGHYFRHIYQILNHIDKFNFKSTMKLSDKSAFQKRYANILRAQLSSHELVLLLLNCTKDMVDKGKFLKLVVKYNFLEHLPATKEKGGVPFIHELKPGAEKIFADFYPEYLKPTLNPYGAFGNNEIFKEYIDLKRDEARNAAEAKKAAEAKAALDPLHPPPANSPGPVVD